jgi:methyl-accepting chemotaxis protein
MKPSILRNLLTASMAAGVGVGALFPVITGYFVDWHPGAQLWFAVSCLLAGAGLGLFNYWLVNQVLLRRLRQIADLANAISHHDISQTCPIISDDLIGEILDSFNQMARNLRGMIGQIGDATARLAADAAQTAGVTEEACRSAEQQQMAITQVATAMEEMATSVQEVARSTAQAAASAQQAKGEAASAARVATEARGGIDALLGRMDRSATAVRKLEQASGKIGVVLDVIRGIAEQTNLLALNAAIEAARAGEQGRGFAVVADEVRLLARRTQQSTQEIREMIEGLQADTAHAVKVLSDARDNAQASADQVEKAAELLGAIAGAVAAINDMNAQIATATEQQRAVSAEIGANLGSIQAETEHTAAGAKKTAAARDELERLASHLQGLVAQFRT